MYEIQCICVRCINLLCSIVQCINMQCIDIQCVNVQCFNMQQLIGHFRPIFLHPRKYINPILLKERWFGYNCIHSFGRQVVLMHIISVYIR